MGGDLGRGDDDRARVATMTTVAAVATAAGGGSRRRSVHAVVRPSDCFRNSSTSRLDRAHTMARGRPIGLGDGNRSRASDIPRWLALRATLDDLNTLPAAGLVAPLVGIGRVVVLDGDAFDVHDIGSIVEGRLAASPLDCALWLPLATSAPVAKLEPHWSLWIVVTAVGKGVVISERTDGSAIDDPLKAIAVPVDGISMEVVLRVGDWVVDGTVI